MVFVPTAAQFPRSTVQARGTATTVTASTLTTVLSFTNAGSEVLYLDKISVEGNVDGCFQYLLATVIQQTFRTSPVNRDRDVNFPTPLKIAAGAVIDIKVTHESGTPNSVDFAATIFGHRR